MEYIISELIDKLAHTSIYATYLPPILPEKEMYTFRDFHRDKILFTMNEYTGTDALIPLYINIFINDDLPLEYLESLSILIKKKIKSCI